MAIETKSMQLAGNLDTEYKKNLFAALETVKPQAVEGGTLKLSKNAWKQHPMSPTILFQDNYQESFEMRLQQSLHQVS